MKKLIVLCLLITSVQSKAYTLQGEENDVAHGLAGYAVNIAAYGFFKGLFLQGRKPTLEDKIMLHVFSTVFTGMILTLKEVADDSKCHAAGNPKGCLDAGAIGYGMLGSAAANASIFVFQF